PKGRNPRLPSVSTPGFTNPSLFPPPAPSECFMVNGADYRGAQNHTSPDGRGQPCLYWNQTQKHAYNTAKYPNGEWGLGSHNACRNPDGDVQPWCYVLETEEGIYWKYCDIPSCHMPGYIGCFLDSGNPPALSGSSGTSSKLTIQVCIRYCRKRGYKFAGVEAGCACFCGSEGDLRWAQPVGAVECDQVCFGKASELCGGDGRIGVYDVSVGACQGNFSAPSGVIYSPDFPDDYGPDSNCSWVLRPPGSSAVELRFQIFEIRDPNDRLELRDGRSRRLLAQFDGHHRPGSALLLPTDVLFLSFRSDQLLHAQGFAVAYRGERCGWIWGAGAVPTGTPRPALRCGPSGGDSQTLPSDLLHPAFTDQVNSSWTRSADDMAIGAGGGEWDMGLSPPGAPTPFPPQGWRLAGSGGREWDAFPLQGALAPIQPQFWGLAGSRGREWGGGLSPPGGAGSDPAPGSGTGWLRGVGNGTRGLSPPLTPIPALLHFHTLPGVSPHQLAFNCPYSQTLCFVSHFCRSYIISTCSFSPRLDDVHSFRGLPPHAPHHLIPPAEEVRSWDGHGGLERGGAGSQDSWVLCPVLGGEWGLMG
uniref:Kringle-containing protein marking the eye and the nose n=1 Tax=Terrapene triunguis TaxID=2587831 RepID=A0A674J2G0_9SAUR